MDARLPKLPQGALPVVGEGQTSLVLLPAAAGAGSAAWGALALGEEALDGDRATTLALLEPSADAAAGAGADQPPLAVLHTTFSNTHWSAAAAVPPADGGGGGGSSFVVAADAHSYDVKLLRVAGGAAKVVRTICTARARVTALDVGAGAGGALLLCVPLARARSHEGASCLLRASAHPPPLPPPPLPAQRRGERGPRAARDRHCLAVLAGRRRGRRPGCCACAAAVPRG